MSQWAAKRQLAIFIGVIAFFALVAFLIIWPSISKEPTCNDGKQNGSENGVDCGGSCKLVCVSDVAPAPVLWARAFNINDDVYSAVAEVENPNPTLLGLSRPYEFRFYDEENQFITRVVGFTYLPPNQNTTIFEGGIKTGNREIKRTTFTWLDEGSWYKINKDVLDDYMLEVSAISITDETNSPSLEAKIKNIGKGDLPEIPVIAVIYGSDGNAIASSKTLSKTLLSGSESMVYFTWPKGFEESSSRIEIVPVIPGQYFAR